MAARKKATKKTPSTKKTARSGATKAGKAKAKKPVKAKTKAKAPAKTKAKAPAKAKAKAPAKTKAKAPAKTKAKAAPAAATKAKAKAPSKAKTKVAPAPRRDATGHLNPKYAAELRARSRESREDLGNDNAFLRKSRSRDTLAEELGEDAVSTMTSGEDQSERLQDLEVEEESGGPFVRTTAREEYARGTDKSNPRGATREPFPTT